MVVTLSNLTKAPGFGHLKMANLLLLFILAIAPLYGDDVKIDASINPYTMTENQPMDVSVSVTHPSTLKVDPNSFTSEGKPLQVQFVREVVISKIPDLIISFYHFEKAGMEKGLYILPSISVNVGGNVYSSQPSTFEITGPDSKSNSPKTSTPSQQQATPKKSVAISSTKLRLEGFVDGKTTLYPHQKTTVGYRYYYSDNIELTDENIPLIEGKGLIKVGDKDINDYQQDKFAVRQVSQVLEASDPGTYTYGPSLIEGYLYKEGFGGQRSYLQPKIKAESPPVIITVLPFPADGKPTSFNGAVGRFTFNVALNGTSNVAVGDKLQLTLTIAGAGDLDNVPAPDLCCQPGFSGRFKPSDIPAVGVVKDNKKTFETDLTPLSDSITEIPSIEFSFFDPDAKKYTALHSTPIPIKVIAAPEKPTQEKPKIPTSNTSPSVMPEEKKEAAPIEIFGNYALTPADLQDLTFGTWATMYLIPFGVILLMLQAYIKSEQMKLAVLAAKKTSHDILNDAIKEKENASLFYHFIQKALLTHLVELNLIPSADIPAHNLPEDGLSGRIREFLREMEHSRFSAAVSDLSKDEIIERSKQYLEEKS